MDYVDVKYINLVSARLQKFKRVKNNLYNFRCPLCGDSKKNKNKARGYLYQVKNNTNYKCHNCGLNISFNNFLKELDEVMHKQYTFDKFKEGHTGRNFTAETPDFEFESPSFKKKVTLDLPKASENQESKLFLERRKLNPDKFYYVDKFKTWVNTVHQTFDDTDHDEPRIVIPLIYHETLIGVQGRSLQKSSRVKYITIMFDDDAPKIYGFDEANVRSPIYIFEGPFDSTFVKNSVAMCGADIDLGSFDWSDYIYVFDNEPRSREITARIAKSISRGEKVVIWPSTIQEKDVNDMVLAGHDVQSIVESNVYQGLEAKLKFNNWKRI
jgi:transcription elongation factor Elf1